MAKLLFYLKPVNDSYKMFCAEKLQLTFTSRGSSHVSVTDRPFVSLCSFGVRYVGRNHDDSPKVRARSIGVLF